MARTRHSKAAAALERLQQANDALHRWRPRPGRVADIRKKVAERVRVVAAGPAPLAPSPAEPTGQEPLPRLRDPERRLRPTQGAGLRPGPRRTTLWSRASFRARTLARAIQLAIAEAAWRLSLVRFWYRRHRGALRCALAALLLLAL
jgi:hypothetical protein